jgi:integrase
MGTLLKVWVVRHVDAQGRRVAKNTAGARAVKDKSSRWYAQFKDGDGKRRRVPLSTDKAAALQMLAELERGVARGKAGLVDPFAIHRAAPIDDHVAAYLSYLRDVEGVSPKHLRETTRRLRFVLAGCHAATLADVRTDAVEAVLLGLAGAGATGKVQGGAGARTRNTYLSSVRAFTRWCLGSGRVEADPLAAVAVARAKKGKGRGHHLAASGAARRRRRALTADEVARLLDAARRRPLLEAATVRTGGRRGQAVGTVRPEVRERLERLGRERALMYLVMVYTGLRRGELESLRVRHLHLDGPHPWVELAGELTKNREAAQVPLRADLAGELADWVRATGKGKTDRVFRVPTELVKILKRDLALAGIPYRDDQGRTVDVHSLRYTTATLLSRAKVPPRVVQKIMRHSDVKLTMQVYTDANSLDEAEAVAALPKPPLEGGHGG